MPNPALYRWRCIVERFRTPGSTHPSISRIRMILATERVGTSFLSCMASARISSKLSGSFCERRFARSIGRSPLKPSLRHAASSRYSVLLDMWFASAICVRSWLFLAGSRSSPRSGEIMANLSDARVSCQVFTSLFFMGCTASLRFDRESIPLQEDDIEPKSVHHPQRYQGSRKPPELYMICWMAASHPPPSLRSSSSNETPDFRNCTLKPRML